MVWNENTGQFCKAYVAQRTIQERIYQALKMNKDLGHIKYHTLSR